MNDQDATILTMLERLADCMEAEAAKIRAWLESQDNKE